ncbi:MAG: DUF3039 domain-containing protein [Actinomycetales bacterium]|nr:DUF3039 domain-containing protein [Candidatus Phosphoribacter baldrii]
MPRASSMPPDPFEPLPMPSEPGTSTRTSVLEREETVVEPQVQEPGDHERFSHYAHKDKIMEAMVMGTPCVALCGKVWVPSRDPNRFPVCPTCKAIYEDDNAGWLPDDE